MCVLLCLLLYVERECVVCTVCVKGNISRVLFINIHVTYIFCFFLRIFSADQSVILNRPLMCMKLTSTHKCINEKKKVKYTSFVLHITCIVVFCEKMHQNCSIFFFNTMYIVAQIIILVWYLINKQELFTFFQIDN